MRKRVILAALAASLVCAAPAAADRPAHEREYLENYAELRERHGVRAPGCNLISDRYDNRCEGRASPARVRRSNATLERMLYVPPARLPAEVSPAGEIAVTGTSLTGPPISGPVTSGGTYCGLFQFKQSTWEGVGGSGSPCAASPEEQWQRARTLQQREGNAPWPACGQGGASLEAIVECESGGDPRAVGG